uniref:Uncharacterized protein n=1 Tax=Chromera velia CCMP2878 TaxID=1169474 RepID=A0A0G4I9F3_9ALVE|mmetsp:Transcript_14579/g.29332  ORF Transcript_14579/g.29332 Transcript_14579/m.29332 type:complete len:126 (+) Transcript_14579:101-478(+)|eukprot:Cvel_12251.t1-p1 / transcript=Cvel_12251.t1 / gene=Cvel_12251 / organism=Chromera_velia_CCMP2878 / gene_product=hypothetical protein / transcript_product=hypothetical protein / location=Cvel_scaffold793:35681-36055(-) / protein_length=125 / sequence_SO=supercontig / SO=protein_coding / is_pseudo=false
MYRQTLRARSAVLHRLIPQTLATSPRGVNWNPPRPNWVYLKPMDQPGHHILNDKVPVEHWGVAKCPNKLADMRLEARVDRGEMSMEIQRHNEILDEIELRKAALVDAFIDEGADFGLPEWSFDPS